MEPQSHVLAAGGGPPSVDALAAMREMHAFLNGTAADPAPSQRAQAAAIAAVLFGGHVFSPEPVCRDVSRLGADVDGGWACEWAFWV